MVEKSASDVPQNNGMHDIELPAESYTDRSFVVLVPWSRGVVHVLPSSSSGASYPKLIDAVHPGQIINICATGTTRYISIGGAPHGQEARPVA